MKRLVTVFFAIAILAVATCASAGIIFSDDWSDLTVQNPTYSPIGADWVVTVGTFSADANYPPSPSYYNPWGTTASLLVSNTEWSQITTNFGMTMAGTPVEARFMLYQPEGTTAGYRFDFGMGNSVANKHFVEMSSTAYYYFGTSGFTNFNQNGEAYPGLTDAAIETNLNYMKLQFDPATGFKVWQATANVLYAYDDPALVYELVAYSLDNFLNVQSLDTFTISSWSGLSWVIDNVEIVGTLALGSISGKVNPADYGGAISDILVNVYLTKGGVTTTHAVIPDSNGNFTIDGLLAGDYDVSMKACSWLKKFVGTVAVNASMDSPIGTVSLISGDLDGDNEVTSTDLSILGLNLGTAGD